MLIVGKKYVTTQYENCNAVHLNDSPRGFLLKTTVPKMIQVQILLQNLKLS